MDNRAKDLQALLLQFEVEQLLYKEAALLDAWELDEWRKLLTDDASYFVPPNNKPYADHADTLFIIADDAVRLNERIIRLKDVGCHAEFPRSRTRRIISNVRVFKDDDAAFYSMKSNFIVYRNRRKEDIRAFTGEYVNKLVRIDGSLRIHERRAILDAEELGHMGVISFIL